MEEIIKEYQEQFRQESNSLGNKFGVDGNPNRAFLYKLCLSNEDVIFNFLVKCKLICSVVKCVVCNIDMRVIAAKKCGDLKTWYCGNSNTSSGIRCKKQCSIRCNSFFNGSKLKFGTILIFEFFRNSSTNNIKEDLGIHSEAIADWRSFCSDILIDFLEYRSEIIGGVDKVVEMDESKMGNRKFLRGGSRIEGEWIIGGIEQGSGKIFLVAVSDRSGKTLISLIEQYIAPGTRIISEWNANDRLGKKGLDHLEDNHFVTFEHSEAGTNTTTSETTWKHFKSSFADYRREGGSRSYIAWCMFNKICSLEGINPFVKFLDLVVDINWEHYYNRGRADEGSSK